MTQEYNGRMVKNFFFMLLVAIFFSGFYPHISYSADFKFGQDYFLKKEEVKDGDFYVGAGNVTLAGPVRGDLFALGFLNIFASEAIGKDAFLVGRTVNSLSDVEEDLRVVAGNALIGGKIGKDLVMAVVDVKTHPEIEVSGDMMIVARKASIDGTVFGKAVISGGEVFLNGTFNGPVEINANEVHVGSGAALKEGILYTSPFPAFLEEGATIDGEIVFKESSLSSKKERFIPTFWGVWFLIKFVILLVGALVLHGVFRRISDRFVSEGAQNSVQSLLWGFLFILAVPFSLLLVTLTFIGIPFVLLGLSIFILTLVLAFFYSPILVGSVAKKFIAKDNKYTVTWKTILLGIAIITALSYLPYIGVILRSVIFLTALGAILKVLVHKFSEVR